MLGLDGDQDFEKACIGDWRHRCFMLGLGDERVAPSPVLPSGGAMPPSVGAILRGPCDGSVYHIMTGGAGALFPMAMRRSQKDGRPPPPPRSGVRSGPYTHHDGRDHDPSHGSTVICMELEAPRTAGDREGTANTQHR